MKKSFIRNILFLLIIILLSNLLYSNEKKEIIIPNELKIGDTIGIIAPAGYTTSIADYEIEYLKNQGFNIVYGASFFEKWYTFGGNDDLRAKDINEMFKNNEIKAIFAIKGGYGTIRMVDKLDYDLIKRNPKIFSGFSDITTLLIAINEKTGLVTYHGPMSSNFKEIPEITEESFKRTFMEKEKFDLLQFDDTYIVEKIGKGKGKITGGNLSLIVASLGTEYEIDTENKILFIEETNEPTYKIDRMLQQLKLAGKFNKVQGIILGNFKNPKKQDETDMNFDKVIEDNFKNLKIPIIKDFKSGHVRPFITVPIGLEVEIETFEDGKAIVNILR